MVASYGGSSLLAPVTKYIDLPLYQINYVGSQLFGLVCAVCLRLLLHPVRVGPTVRHVFTLAVGFIILYLCIGWQLWHCLLQATGCYILLLVLPSNLVHIAVFVFALGYLLWCNVVRFMTASDEQTFDHSFPITVATQKLTSLAFGIADWRRHQESGLQLKPEQKERAVKKMPTMLEFYSFIFGFQGVMAGPFCFFTDFIDFIEGRHLQKIVTSDDSKNEKRRHNISPVGAVGWKLLSSMVLIIIFIYFVPYFPVSVLVDDNFTNSHNFLYKAIYLYICLFGFRVRYYIGWILADAVNNAAGLGFSGFDERGEAKWDLMTNVKLFKIELATSFKSYMDNWNILTMAWLRHSCYIRAPFQPVLLTFILSALWHGVYPGYTIMFITSAIVTIVGRKIRRNVRPLFQTTTQLQYVYAVLTWLGTQLTMAYVVVPFVLLDLTPTLKFYNHVYWFLHVIIVILAVAMPAGKPSSQTPKSPSPKRNSYEAGTNSVGQGHSEETDSEVKSKDV
ncbi:lysophospholipid acyltransferase 2-like [Gigantopelta aegis]|uniref:lysophospholipid acyltransferase 2-like n=1 Tax=Gigantopelta aegis TaxID=1735272 RepID=UPI001B88DB1E|nr:lysophospholipid acyltransferase 2-like [Gigantopelta aegis]